MGRRFTAVAAAELGSRGAAMVEYSVVVGLIAAISVLVVSLLGRDVFDLFHHVGQLFDPTP